ncbi:hypothetical protein MNB_SV-9-506 [hydrothermal vent metagenome]|uniref:Cytochrome C oxidase subunit IV n=1 Tax=hydrothermal vent metagenome TaxID=652676 RepID=A0A1W1BWX8_9ZZZZ
MDKFTKVYITLIIFTFFTFSLGWFELISEISIILLLITTFIKGHLVIEYFMGLNEVSGKYRYIPSIWLGVIILFIGLGYFL